MRAHEDRFLASIEPVRQVEYLKSMRGISERETESAFNRLAKIGEVVAGFRECGMLNGEAMFRTLYPFLWEYMPDDWGAARRELVFGRSRFNEGGGEAWYWYKNLITLPPTHGDRREDAPTPSGPDGVPDAPVRLRKGLAATPKAGENQ